MPSESGDKDKISRETVAVPLMRLLDSLAARLSTGKHEKRNRIILVLLTALFLTCLIIPRQQFIPVGYKTGDIATSDIRATQDYLLEDRPLTEKKRAEAEAAAPIVYDFKSDAAMELLQRFEKALALIREVKSETAPIGKDALPGALSEILGGTLTGAEIGALGRVKSDRALLAEIDRVAGRLYSRKIVADRKTFAADLNHGVQVVNPETKQEIAAGDYTSYIDSADARDFIAGSRMAVGGDPRDGEIIKLVLARAVKPNVTFDRETTEAKKREARNAVRPVLFKLKRGEMIVRVGERISEEQALKLEKIFETRHGLNSIFVGAGIFGLVMVLFYFPYRFARKNIRKFNPDNKDLLLLCLLTLMSFVTLKIAFVDLDCHGESSSRLSIRRLTTTSCPLRSAPFS